MKNEVLRLERVTQTEDGVVLLDNLSMHIFQGEIMGLLCLNTHGKEALVRLLCRNLSIHYGYVYFQERLVNNYAHSSNNANRVSVIERTSRLVEDLTVADNIFVLRPGFKKYFINPRVLSAQLAQFTKDLGVRIEAGELVSQLSFFEKCVVELLRAVVTGVKLVVIRDISNFVSAADLVRFHSLIRRYAREGMSFLYICNHHEEAFRICHRIALMEDGKVLKVLNRQDFRDETVLMFSQSFYHRPPAMCRDSGGGILSFCNVRAGGMDGLSFAVARGECVVLLDINNTIPADLMALLSGRRLPAAGEILLDGVCWSAGPKMLEKQMCFLGENPVETALYREMSYLDNLCFWLDRKFPSLWRKPAVRRSVRQEYEPLAGDDIFANDITRLSLSSLYSLVYYKVHLYRPKVLFCVQPFAGADMYLRRHILELIEVLKARGIAVVILAVSISDSLEVADRLLVAERGKLRREYRAEEFPTFRAAQ